MKFYIQFTSGRSEMIECVKMSSNNNGLSFLRECDIKDGNIYGIFIPFSSIEIMKQIV